MNNKKGDLKKGRITDINKLNTKGLLTEEIYNSDIVPKLMNINEHNYSIIINDISEYIKTNGYALKSLVRYMENNSIVRNSMEIEVFHELLEYYRKLLEKEEIKKNGK